MSSDGSSTRGRGSDAVARAVGQSPGKQEKVEAKLRLLTSQTMHWRLFTEVKTDWGEPQPSYTHMKSGQQATVTHMDSEHGHQL